MSREGLITREQIERKPYERHPLRTPSGLLNLHIYSSDGAGNSPYCLHILIPGLNSPPYEINGEVKTYFDPYIASLLQPDQAGGNRMIITFPWVGQTRYQCSADRGTSHNYDISAHPAVLRGILDEVGHIVPTGCKEVIFEAHSMGARGLLSIAGERYGAYPSFLSGWGSLLGLKPSMIHLALHQPAFGIHSRWNREIQALTTLPLAKFPGFAYAAPHLLNAFMHKIMREGIIDSGDYFKNMLARDILDPRTTIQHIQGIREPYSIGRVLDRVFGIGYGSVGLHIAENDQLVDSDLVGICASKLKGCENGYVTNLPHANHTALWG